MGAAAVQGLLLMRFWIVHIGFREVTRGTCLYFCFVLAGEMGRRSTNKKKTDDYKRTLVTPTPHWHSSYKNTSGANRFKLSAELQSSCLNRCRTTRASLVARMVVSRVVARPANEPAQARHLPTTGSLLLEEIVQALSHVLICDAHVSSSPFHHASLVNAGVNTAHYPLACPSSLAVTNIRTGNAVRLPPDISHSVAPATKLD